MRLNGYAALVCATMTMVTVGACESAPGTVTLETDDQKASYAIGRQMGQQLAPVAERLDMAALTRGIREAVNEEESAIPEEELSQVLQTFSQSVQEEQQAARAAEAEENKTAGAAFLGENAQREEVTTTASGLQYEVVEQGDGERPGPGDQVTLHYRGTLVDGTEFDSSRDGDPVTFGVSGLIQGFSEGLQLMPVGSTYKFYVPAELAYGPQGSQAIGPNQTLIFEVELLGIQ